MIQIEKIDFVQKPKSGESIIRKYKVSIFKIPLFIYCVKTST